MAVYQNAQRNGKVVIESYENENLKITRFFNGEVEIKFAPTCDKRVKKMYKRLMRRI